MSVFKPAPPHNPMWDGAPAMCLCVECCRLVAAKRCTAVRGKNRCGNYKGHSGMHTMLIDTVFEIAEERAARAEESS